jgi:hypothetical protein
MNAREMKLIAAAFACALAVAPRAADASFHGSVWHWDHDWAKGNISGEALGGDGSLDCKLWTPSEAYNVTCDGNVATNSGDIQVSFRGTIVMAGQNGRGRLTWNGVALTCTLWRWDESWSNLTCG